MWDFKIDAGGFEDTLLNFVLNSRDAKDLPESQGYHVLTASNGKEAIDLLANRNSIKLLFSDIVMPGGINGCELARLATENNPELKVILASGYSAKSSDQHSL